MILNKKSLHSIVPLNKEIFFASLNLSILGISKSAVKKNTFQLIKRFFKIELKLSLNNYYYPKNRIFFIKKNITFFSLTIKLLNYLLDY